MLQTDRTAEHGDQVAAIRHDEGLTELLRIHLAGPDVARRRGEPTAPDSIPALLAAYWKLGSVRHDFPVVLIDDDADTPVASLASIVDEVLSETARGAEGDRLRRNIYRLEESIKRLADTKPGRRLSELWELAAKQLARESEQPDRLGPSLDAAKRVLSKDGRLLACAPRTAKQLFEHAWGPLQSERARRERAILDELIARLSEVLESERARSPKSNSPEALEAALGGEHAGGIDFESLSALLRDSRHGRARVTPVKRTKRLRVARKVLESERALLPALNGNSKRRKRARQNASICNSCAEALELFAAELQRTVELFRAIRVATLELENRYREERHGPFFETFGPGQLTPEEFRALPPLLVFLNGDALDDAEKSALIDILGSDMPVKVVLEVHELPLSDTGGAPAGTFTEWTREIAAMATSLGEAFVMQTAASHLPQLVPTLVEGLRYEGPALFCVYTGPDEPDAATPHYLRCASAVESRAFPSFAYSPDRGADLASRFTLEGNPQVDRAWPEHGFEYETSDGHGASESLEFTCVDFLALDARFSEHFVPVPPSCWHANMVPMARYLELPREQTLDKVPYVYLVDGEERLHRMVVRRALITFARKCAANWRRLQEFGGIRNSHALRLLEQERARLEEEMQSAIESSQAAHPVRAETPATEPAPAEATPAEQVAVAAPSEAQASAVETVPDQAYVDTDLCTTCDDCTDRNPRMFVYNEEKQAYIADLEAGSYRELVEAAENCPVCIIHPGKPLNPNEPGLEELEKRAAEFN
ncbi:MAG: hypothetical protein BMS9Abin01_2185 [Gammaproteobacteria bacterium]|nr:MAG: hypothetical protein BMS9Abin01_2185 [Gammaproteobacteria bacterium]